MQLDFPWALGPAPGRHSVRAPGSPDGPPAHVVVVEILGAPERRRRGGRRDAEVEPGSAPPPSPVTTGRAGVIDASAPLEDAGVARAWLRDAGEPEATTALAVLNRVLHAHRVAVADPWARDVSLADALAVRLGYASGEQAADGRLAEGRELAFGKRRRWLPRPSALRPQEHMAAILGGRVKALACEELALRARVDFATDRPREAVLSVGLALEAALTELTADALADRVAELADLRERVGRAASTALGALPSPAELEAAELALERLEAALRARAAELS